MENTFCSYKNVVSMEIDINRRIQSYQRMLVLAHKHPLPEKTAQQYQIKKLTLKFKLLLAQKARQEAIDKVCNDNSSNTQNSSASQTDNTRPRISIRDILKKKVTGCG